MVKLCMVFGAMLGGVGVGVYPCSDKWTWVVKVGCVGAAVLIHFV